MSTSLNLPQLTTLAPIRGRFARRFLLIAILAVGLIGSSIFSNLGSAAEIQVLTKENYSDLAPRGKEVDAIYGDYVLRNERIVCVIAKPVASRNANMTVRGVGGAIIDLTSAPFPNDQLSAFYPTAARFSFHSDETTRFRADGEAREGSASGKSVSLQFVSTRSPIEGLTANLTYTLNDKSGFVIVRTVIRNQGDEEIQLNLTDGVRADRSFKFGSFGDSGFWAYDEWFRQCYGVLSPDHKMSIKSGRMVTLSYQPREGRSVVPAGGQIEYSRRVYPSGSLLQARGIADRMQGKETKWTRMDVADANGPVANALITVVENGKIIGMGRTTRKGKLQFPLAAKQFEVRVEATGRPAFKGSFESNEIKIEMQPCGYLKGRVVDDQGEGIPCKVAIHAKPDGEGVTPNYGPDSGATGIQNLRYTANGEFRCEVAPGEYQVIISRGPEYDAIFKDVVVKRNETTEIDGVLPRVVDTTGWISADFHSHSSPSGDNTGSQFGRVQNLLAEHIEFAPCTEHNRIASYAGHLRRLSAERWMATCPGMELTGSPLPINHQNAFPLKLKPRTQDGGGPVTDSNPVVQIERLAMWDGGSEKLVQANHPNLVQMLGDKDLDGKFDGGFEKMFGFMDVIEVHPPAGIFTPPAKAPVNKLTRNPMFHWLQMLNRGYRITGVVNTDAHYNYHGSGWIRNYIASPTDLPADIKTMDVVRASEAGQVVMTTGPFLSVTAKAGDGQATPGQDLKAKNGKTALQVRIQCPNWLDVNRVQVFVNGRPDESLNFTRRTHPKMFHEDVVRFDERIELALKQDAHVVVATIGEGLKLGSVAGPRYGQQPPVAVANPIFVDVDGDGFQPNGDLLGLPIPLK